ncbi:MAG: hypothetical protein AB7N65_00470 [Vicinamibacterales bacterium]
MPTDRTRSLRPLLVLCAASMALLVGYITWRTTVRPGERAPVGEHATAPTSLAAIQAQPRVYFRSTKRDEFGRLVVATLARPNDERVVSDLQCDRVAFGRGQGLCLVDTRAQLRQPGLVHVLGANLSIQRTLPILGVPSRARVASDGRHGATTVFVTGENYLGAGFSTRTHIYALPAGAASPDLEQFATVRNGRPFRAADFNIWGVTFTHDSNVFLATLATAGRIYLVEGDVSARSMRVVGADVECPSLSPNGRLVAFKRRVPGGGGWRLHVLERATGRDWPLAGETRSIDDQVEWLDDDRVLYGYASERGLPEDAVNVWVISVREESTEAPRVFIRSALSPTVVR